MTYDLRLELLFIINDQSTFDLLGTGGQPSTGRHLPLSLSALVLLSFRCCRVRRRRCCFCCCCRRCCCFSCCCCCCCPLLACCVSCLVFVLFCLVLPLSLSLFCLICFVLSFCCVALCVCRLGSLCRLIFGRFGSSWGSMLAILGRLGGLLGAFWEVFWASWAVLGGLERSRKRLMDPSQQRGKSRAAKNRFLDRLGGPREGQDGPKTAP